MPDARLAVSIHPSAWKKVNSRKSVFSIPDRRRSYRAISLISKVLAAVR
jgi:hypothetical protein